MQGFDDVDPSAQATALVLLDDQALSPKLLGPATAGEDRDLVSASQQLHGIEAAQHTGAEDQPAHRGGLLMSILRAAILAKGG
jgi:hypothetical protein